MKKAKLISLLLALAMLLSLAACGAAPAETPAATEAPTEAPVEATEAPAESAEITVTDLIGREITVKPGSYQRVVCIGAGALRLYSYIGDVSLLCGVEDIDNETLSERPKMFDSVARPYVLAPPAASAGRMPRAPRRRRSSPASRISSSPFTAMRIRPMPCRSSSASRS